MSTSPGPGPSRSHRRAPATDSSQPPSIASSSAAGAINATPRSSSGSSKSQSSSSRAAAFPPDKQVSQIEKSVTHLLVATKQLLETLTQWSRKAASEGEVSDVYVRLGYEFNLACRAFNAIGVDTSDLGPVPDLLRSILEDTLSQDASPQSLDRFLPRIRDIIINLLHGLKKKQAKLRMRHGRDVKGGSGSSRAASAGSSTGGDTGLTAMLDEIPSGQPSQKRPSQGRQSSLDNTLPPRTSSVVNPAERQPSRRDTATKSSDSSSSMSSNTMQNIPVMPPYERTGEAQNDAYLRMPEPGAAFNHPPPPPPPKQQDALGALQRSGELERRASRRFSAYQISKHLGASANGVPVLPTAQNSPIPNRGRNAKDVRESMNAVRSRGSYMKEAREKQGSRVSVRGDSPASKSFAERKNDAAASSLRLEQPLDDDPDDSPVLKTPDDKLRKPEDFELDPKAQATAPPIQFTPSEDTSVSDAIEKSDSPRSQTPEQDDRVLSQTATTTPPQSRHMTPDYSPTGSGKSLTIFLQYKSKIKKHVLPEGYTDLTMARLQLAFIEKFAWNTHNNGVDLPEIYIQDPVSGVRHELEDLNDVKDRSVLALNVEVLDEVKKHIDDGLGGVRKMIEGLRDVVDGQNAQIAKINTHQTEAAKDMARLAAIPAGPAASRRQSKIEGPAVLGDNVDISKQIAELQALRRDIAVVRQTQTSFVTDIEASMSAVRAKAGSLKTAAMDVSVPTFQGDAGRIRINSGKKDLADESEKLVARVDDLQDLVEDLRKDVVARGVRPLPRQLESVSKDISAVTKEVKKMQDFLKREKPIWTKIWEKELQLVCEERDQLTMQEDLAADLEDDLEKAAQTFSLVEQATKQQSLTTAQGGQRAVNLRSVSHGLALDPNVDPRQARDGVLGEVRALQPNHETRLEAIERAEKARQRELESRRGNLFQKELNQFVEEGKLKKSGGVEETERMRKAKDEKNRKDAFIFLQQRQAEMERRRAEAAAAAAAAPAAEEQEEGDDSAEASTPTTDEAAPTTEEPDTPAVAEDGEAAADSAEKDDAITAEDKPAAQEDTPATPTSPMSPASNRSSSSAKRTPRGSWLPSIFSGGSGS